MLLTGILLSLMLSCSYINTVRTFQYFGLRERIPAVAFTALLSKDTNIASLGIVKYDKVLTNVGRAYRPSTGIFTAPYKGIYTISCSLMSHPSNSVHLDIMKNGKMQTVLFAASGTYPQTGITLHLLLNKEDKIWIQNENRRIAKLDISGKHNLFSGSLITTL
ncbi:complement C1q-like protein 4 [Crassostrea angulata]|uniref:complement C1q-like protein 4 n=1 Tax=Magallana angulata TaxID=2784310 RepID=UPI0022B08895|nr:complement C1q-like protein 4 [Crassostrea angulata]